MLTLSTRLTGKQISAALPLVKAAFPQYHGRKISVNVSDREMSLESYWCEGSRDYYVAVELATAKVISVPQNGCEMGGRKEAIKYEPRPGVAIVQHSYNGSAVQSITIHLHPDNAGNKMLTAG